MEIRGEGANVTLWGSWGLFGGWGWAVRKCETRGAQKTGKRAAQGAASPTVRLSVFPPTPVSQPFVPKALCQGPESFWAGRGCRETAPPPRKDTPWQRGGGWETPPRPLPGSCPRLRGQQEQPFLPFPLFLVSLPEGPPPHYLFGGGSPLTPPSSCRPPPSTTMQLFIRAQSLHTVEVSSAETIAQLKVSPQDTRLCPSPQ